MAELKRWKLVAGEQPGESQAAGPRIALARAIDPVATDSAAFGSLPEVVENLRARWARIERAARARGVTTLAGLPRIAREIVLRDLNDLSPKTRREYAGIIRRVCKAHGINDPLPGLMIRGKSAARRALTDDEVRRLLAAAEGETRLLILIGLHTGARLGDICRLTWGDVDGGCIRFTPSKTKHSSGARVAVPIHPALAEALPPRGLPTAPVLPEMWARYRKHRHRPLWWIKEAFRKAGIATLEKLEGRGRRVVNAVNVKADKLTRALPWIAMAEAGRVVIVRRSGGVDDQWISEFMAEADAFPDGGRHDDLIDAVTLGYHGAAAGDGVVSSRAWYR